MQLLLSYDMGVNSKSSFLLLPLEWVSFVCSIKSCSAVIYHMLATLFLYVRCFFISTQKQINCCIGIQSLHLVEPFL